MFRCRIFNAKFKNRAKPKSVRASAVQHQHQIDLVSMKGTPTTYNGKKYKYILSLMDVFSRYHLLVPLETKTSREAVKFLRR